MLENFCLQFYMKGSFKDVNTSKFQFYKEIWRGIEEKNDF